ncbi:hypothetical protein AVEN_158265-1 [Araneus ventricosus]|uniref:Histone-lysine N-methyltransferase SETMAR n=1 Tax=Araneus ventricosus TaxID=182803 RepID=A0A4Y2S2Q3_ARAVE|nr:hypothetical protein AVEN_158265-1 [Araneus ventricosus]
MQPASRSGQTLRQLRRAILTSGVFIHYNASPHNAFVRFVRLLEQFKLDMSDHPAYSPDLATSDYHLFSEFKNWLGGQSFEEIQSYVKAHLTSLVTTFFEEVIGNLDHQYEKCLNLHGDYVEKQTCLNINVGNKFIFFSTLVFFYGRKKPALGTLES